MESRKQVLQVLQCCEVFRINDLQALRSVAEVLPKCCRLLNQKRGKKMVGILISFEEKMSGEVLQIRFVPTDEGFELEIVSSANETLLEQQIVFSRDALNELKSELIRVVK